MEKVYIWRGELEKKRNRNMRKMIERKRERRNLQKKKKNEEETEGKRSMKEY